MNIASRPQYGDIIGKADDNGNVRFTDAFEKFLDDILGGFSQTAGAVGSLNAPTGGDGGRRAQNAPVIAVAAAPYECSGQEDVVVATAGVQIKLPANPRRNKNIKIIKATAANLPVHGNGKLVMGDTDMEIRTAIYSSLNITYVLDVDQWFLT